jgi:hypothetical protein
VAGAVFALPEPPPATSLHPVRVEFRPCLSRLACLARPAFHAPRLVRSYLICDNLEEFNLEY